MTGAPASLAARGLQLAPLRVTPTALQVFRFSAVTWNSHRVHYDDGWAQAEGHPGVLVQSHLRGALALRCVGEGLDALTGADYEVHGISYRVRRPATPGLELTYTAHVADVADDGTLTIELAETTADGRLGLEATATAVPRGRN